MKLSVSFYDVLIFSLDRFIKHLCSLPVSLKRNTFLLPLANDFTQIICVMTLKVTGLNPADQSKQMSLKKQ